MFKKYWAEDKIVICLRLKLHKILYRWVSTLYSCTDLKVSQVHSGRASTAVGQLASVPQMLGASCPCFSSGPQVLLILTALQPSIFSVLANGGQIACSPPFSSKVRSQGEHIGAPLSFRDGQEGRARGERTSEQRLGHPGFYAEHSEMNHQEILVRLSGDGDFSDHTKESYNPTAWGQHWWPTQEAMGSIISSWERTGCGLEAEGHADKTHKWNGV